VRAFTVFATLGFLVGPTVSSVAEGQQERRIPDDATCTTCRIELRHITTLTSQKAPDADGRPFAIVRQSRAGRYVVLAGDLILYAYDSAGRNARTIGRRGRGLNEFQLPVRLFSSLLDTLLVIDPAASRLTVLGPDGTIVQTLPFLSARPFDAVSLPDGRVLLNAVVRDRDHVGYPLHVVTRDGRIERSFGADRPDYVYNAPPLWRRRLTEARHTAVWTARELEYVLEQWAPATGERLSALRRISEWFPAVQDSFTVPTPTVPPPTYVADILETSDSLLWIAAAVPDPRWFSGLGPPERDEAGRVTYRPSDYRKLYDSMIEIIAPETGVVLVSQRLDDYVWGFVGDQHLATFRETGQSVFIDIHLMSLIR